MESTFNNTYKDDEVLFKLISSIGDWIWYIDRKGIIRYCSPTIDNLINLTPNQIIGNSINKYLSDEITNEKIIDIISISEKTINEINVKIIDNKGDEIPVLMYTVPQFAEDGTYRGFSGINKLCNKKGKQQKSFDQKSIQKILFKKSKDLICLVDSYNKYNIKFINENQFSKQLFYSSEDLLGKNLLDFIHNDDKDRIIEIIKSRKLNEKDNREIRIKNRKKEFIWFEVFNKDFLNYDSSKDIFILFKNISTIKKLQKEIDEHKERFEWLYNEVPEIRYWKLLIPKKAITAVQKSQEMLEKVIDNIPQYIFWKDKELNYLGCNTNFSKLINLDNPDNISGITNKKIPLFKNYLTQHEKKEKDVIKHNRPKLDSIESLILSNGKKAYFNINRIPLLDLNNQVVGLLSTYEDITDRKDSEEKLKASEEKYRNILENIKECYFETDLIGNITFINDAFSEATGYKKYELIGMNFSDFCDDKNNEKLHKAFNKVYVKEKGIRDVQYKGHFKNNKEVVIESSVYLKKDSEGKKVGFCGLLRIITEKYLLQQKLKESENKYRIISENANDFISIINEKFAYEYINELPHLKGMGYSKEELIGKKCLEFIHPDDINTSIKTLNEGFYNKEPGWGEVRFKHKNGSWIWIDVKGTPFIDIDGKLKAVLMARDITGRKKTEEKLKESEDKLKKLNKQLGEKILERTRELRISEEKFRTITEQSLLGVAILQNNYVLYTNLALSKMIGYSEEELRNWTLKDLTKCFHPSNIVSIPLMIKEIENLGLGNTLQYTLKIITSDKNNKYLELFLRRIPYKSSSAILISAVDITIKKKAEIKLIESERKLKQQNEELKKLDKLKTDFITMAAHELKTPLISISGYVDLIILREKTLKEDIKEELMIILNNSKRLESYVEKLLDALKIDAKKMDFKMIRIKVPDILNTCLTELEYQIKKKNIEIKLEVNNDISLNVDHFRISQVFSNLINNALKFTPSNCAIQISDEIKDDLIIYKIKDNGIGLTQDEINKLFGKFIMLNNDIENFSKGSGLGLYISKGIIEAHKGKIWVESEGKNKGSTFHFSLPLP